MIEAMVRYSFPYTSWTCEPTPAAPIVCAMVFKVRMAVSGLTASSAFNLDQMIPRLSSSFCQTAT